MTDQPRSAAQSPSPSLAPTATEKELVRLMARIAMKQDYKMFAATGKIPHASPRDDEEK